MSKASRILMILLSGLACLFGAARSSCGQLNFEGPPLNYQQASPTDAVAQLIKDVESGKKKLAYSSKHGWLHSLLEHLDVPVESQLLVFSKTSLQLHKISPRTPRALYFNDDIYVGWCQRGDVLEIAATDDRLGAVFYTLAQEHTEEPVFQRDRGSCLTCHASHRTQGVPGFVVRSVYPDFSGRPRGGTRTYTSDHSSAFEQRFGGWYVTGLTGDLPHMGNVLAKDSDNPEHLEKEAPADPMSLRSLCNTTPYLRDDSDVVALMVLEHQTQMHNLITRAHQETLIAMHYDRGINKALGRPIDTVSPSTKRRIEKAADNLVRYMLFVDEVPLPNSIEGSDDFKRAFEGVSHTKTDHQRRSLRQLDLQTRLFKYPCSYLIYSSAFDSLPEPAGLAVYNRLLEILNGDPEQDGFTRLTVADRLAILEILQQTKPEYFKRFQLNS